MSDDATQRLAAFAAGLQLPDLPEPVRDHCKAMLLDALACALAGHRGEETGQVAALAAALGQSADSSVIGDNRLSLAGATVLNSFLVPAVTMCDVHRPTLTHITPEVIPPALAIAERDSLSGRDLLLAIAAGCEVTTRIGIGLDYPVFRANGWHGPGVIGPFGAAAAAGRLLGFDADAMARAFGLAGSQAAGTFAAWGTPTVKFHQCRGALSGLMAALLAQQGFVATREFLTAKDGGLYSTYSGGGRPDLAVADLGRRWELEQIALRPWPSAVAVQSLITAMFDLVEKNTIDAAVVTRIRIALARTAFDMHGGFARYDGKFEALLSAHYAAAAILHDRALTLAQFEPDRYDDPVLRRCAAEQVEARLDPSLAPGEVVVDVEVGDGTTLTARCTHPRGAPENPMSRAQVEEKFRTYATPRLPDAQTDAVIEAINRLETLASARSLVDLLRAAPRQTARSRGRTARRAAPV